MFSERDLVRAVADGVDLHDEQVGVYMTESPVITQLNAGVGDAIAKMNEFGLRHVLVTDKADLVGVISVRDLLGLLGTAWPEL